MALIGVILAFQNCSGQFEVLNFSQENSVSSNSEMTSLSMEERFTASEVDQATTIDVGNMTCTVPSQTNYMVPSNLKYFGVVGAFADDTNDFENYKKNVIGTLKMGNLQFVEVKVFDDPAKTKFELRRRMDFALQFPVAAVLSVSNVFWSTRVPGELRRDRDVQWQAVVEVLQSYPRSRIAAFYLLDEPFWNAKALGISEPQMYAWLSNFGAQIKAAFPESKLTFVEAYPLVNPSLRWPDVFDWVGADCYVEDCGGGKSIFDLYSILKPKLKSHQKFVMIPTAIVFRRPENFTQANSIWMKTQFDRYAAWIATEPLVEASFSFIYHYGGTAEEMTGLEKSCHSQEAHQMYAAKFRASAGSLKFLPLPPYIGASCSYSVTPNNSIVPVGGTISEYIKCQGLSASMVVKVVGTQNGKPQINEVIQLSNSEFRSEHINTGELDAGKYARRVEVYDGGRLVATSGMIQAELAAVVRTTPTPTPTPVPTPTPTPTPTPPAVVRPAVLSCDVTSRVLGNYSMIGTIQPASDHVGRLGAIYIAGFLPSENTWISFDGVKWVKLEPGATNLSSLGGVKPLPATAFSGSIFKNEDLTSYAGAQVYIAYGVSPNGTADAAAVLQEMLDSNRFKQCDVLPAN